MESTDWIDQFSALRELPADLQSKLQINGRLVSLPTGSRIYAAGQTPGNFLLVLKGSVRVQQVSESGREITLYRIASGESCALTTACLIGYDDYSAEAVAETAVRCVALPRQTFDDLISQSPIFRKFVFASFSARFTDLFRVIDQVAFARMDVRLAQKLLELSEGKDAVVTTQQQLASELGTAREVVGRLMSEFQRRGWVSAGRGSLIITDRAHLEALSGKNG